MDGGDDDALGRAAECVENGKEGDVRRPQEKVRRCEQKVDGVIAKLGFCQRHDADQSGEAVRLDDADH